MQVSNCKQGALLQFYYFRMKEGICRGLLEVIKGTSLPQTFQFLNWMHSIDKPLLKIMT